MDEEQRRRIREADQAARTMFNVLPQGATNAISSAVQSVGNAASNLRVGPLIRTGGPQPAERPTPTATTLPSGTPMGGFDIYPTRPQMPPTAPTPFPYGSALGPSIYTQTPTQTNLQTGMATPAPTGFGAINPPAFPQAQESISRLGLMGGTLSSGQVGPLPLEQITPMVAGQRPIIESGPVAMTATGTLNPEQRGRQAIQTPYGTVYATTEQAANMNRPRTIAQQSTRSPAEQQALLAQMRERGSAIGKRIGGQQEAYFTQRRAEMAELNRATAQAAQAGMSPQSIREARRAYTSQQPSSIGGIQQQFASFLNTPSFGETPMANRTAFVRAPFGIPSGGPQPAQTQPVARAQQFGGGNTTQRSWDNYVGPNPIESRVGTPFYDRSPRYGRRA